MDGTYVSTELCIREADMQTNVTCHMQTNVSLWPNRNIVGKEQIKGVVLSYAMFTLQLRVF